MHGVAAIPAELVDLLFSLAPAIAGAVFLVFVLADAARERHTTDVPFRKNE
jgi:hypothetical protein